MPENNQNNSQSAETLKTPMTDIALCLSGGGYRAALFHLGALRRLNELGILGRVSLISSVSGGSILAAHLAKVLKEHPMNGPRIENWEEIVAEPFREFCRFDIRTWPVVKRFLLPWNWFRRSTQVNTIAKTYEKRLTGLSLSDLPESPRFAFCATDVMNGVNWVFTREKVGSYKAGYYGSPEDWTVAKAVAASSCFPPVFDPMPVGRYVKGRPKRTDTVKDCKECGKEDQDTEFQQSEQSWWSQVRLSDGGVYDNLGLEPASQFRNVLVSDGGAPAKTFKESSFPLKLWLRYFDIASNQVGSLRKRWLMAEFNTKTIRDGKIEPVKCGTYWGIDSGSTYKERPDLSGYDDCIARLCISQIRTDLDKFTWDEMKILENHGYLLANRVISKYVPEFQDKAKTDAKVQHEELLDPKRVQKALKRSHRRVSLWRILCG